MIGNVVSYSSNHNKTASAPPHCVEASPMHTDQQPGHLFNRPRSPTHPVHLLLATVPLPASPVFAVVQLGMTSQAAPSAGHHKQPITVHQSTNSISTKTTATSVGHRQHYHNNTATSVGHFCASSQSPPSAAVTQPGSKGQGTNTATPSQTPTHRVTSTRVAPSLTHQHHEDIGWQLLCFFPQVPQLL